MFWLTNDTIDLMNCSREKTERKKIARFITYSGSYNLLLHLHKTYQSTVFTLTWPNKGLISFGTVYF